MARCFKKHDITLSHKASNTIKTNVCQLKDRTTSLETKNAIYKINCKNCDSVYIGESSKVVGDHVKEQSSNVRRRYQGSLIYKHSNETSHEFDFDNPKVLRGPTHQKWSNFAIFGFIVQFDPWVGAHLWEKIRVLGVLETPQIGGERSPLLGKFESLPISLKLCYYM